MCADEREDDWLAKAARAIADGTPVDWSVSSQDERRDPELVRCIQVISDIAAAGTPTTTPVPARWGPLIIRAVIGRGSFGDVYRAWDPRLGREVALKLLRVAESRRSADADATVIEEGRLMARVRHPNVATVFGADEIDGRVGVWMELVDGHTLEEELTARGPLSPEQVATIGIEVCAALAAVHAAGVVHRDVKAHNVMLERGGRIVLTDFGTGCEQEAAEQTQVAGTVRYLAPEVLEGAPAAACSDIYSVGVLLFHLLTGGYPVPGDSVARIRDAHRRRQRLSPAALRPDVPKQLAGVIERSLSADPHDRFASAADMAKALKASTDDFVVTTTRRGRFPRVVPVIAAAVAFIVFGAFLLFAERSSTHTSSGITRFAGITTRSKAAFDLYQQGMTLLEPGNGEQAQAEELFRQAIVKDNKFASAHIMLAWTLYNQGKPLKDVLEIAERSRSLDGTATEAERLFIEGSIATMKDEYDAAIASYKALARLDPNNYWAVNNLASTYREDGRHDDALPYYKRFADLKPTNFGNQVVTAGRLTEAGRREEAEPYIARARRLLNSGVNIEIDLRRWLDFLPVFDEWRQGRIDGAERALREVEQAHRGELWEAGKGGDNLLSEFIGDCRLTLGQLRKARRAYAAAPVNPDDAPYYQAIWALAAGKRAVFSTEIHRLYMRRGPRRTTWEQAGLLARAGWVHEARECRDAFDRLTKEEGTTEMPFAQALVRYIDGEIAAASGDLKRAYEDFDFALRRLPYSYRYSPLEAMEQVLERRHADESAITLLEQTIPKRTIYSLEAVRGAVWLRLDARLAALYRRTGRNAEAKSIESDLQHLLSRADRDHPILRQLMAARH